MNPLIRIEAWRDDGTLLHAQQHSMESWLAERRLSGGVVWLCTRGGRPSVVLVFRDAGAPAYANNWSYFAGAADCAEDVVMPARLAREGSEELALRDPNGSITTPLLLGASAATPAIVEHVQRRFPGSLPDLRVCDELRALACHRVKVISATARLELHAFASVHRRESNPTEVLELIWYGQLGEVGALEPIDAELDTVGTPLERTVITVELARLAAFMQTEAIAPHAWTTLAHLARFGGAVPAAERR